MIKDRDWPFDRFSRTRFFPFQTIFVRQSLTSYPHIDREATRFRSSVRRGFLISLRDTVVWQSIFNTNNNCRFSQFAFNAVVHTISLPAFVIVGNSKHRNGNVGIVKDPQRFTGLKKKKKNHLNTRRGDKNRSIFLFIPTYSSLSFDRKSFWEYGRFRDLMLKKNHYVFTVKLKCVICFDIIIKVLIIAIRRIKYKNLKVATYIRDNNNYYYDNILSVP